jgi:hypothetical protein
MKTKFTFLICLLFCIQGCFAQMYDGGDLTINAGLSFGLIGYGYGRYTGASGFVPIFVNGEYSLNKNLSIGPYLGFYSRSYNDGDFKFTAISFGGRGTFHATDFLNQLGASIDAKKLDLYATLHLGFENLKWKYRDPSVPGFYSDNSSFIFGPVIGARYWLSPAFGAFFELGRGTFGWASVGISGRF